LDACFVFTPQILKFTLGILLLELVATSKKLRTPRSAVPLGSPE